ncbi:MULTISPECIES: hypothetical protein [unclassified Microcoleus]|uniref:hypothetical protein n=1 Tax=unclassified Microcoleus TaxID=2642155 RepID=UPI002FD744E6
MELKKQFTFSGLFKKFHEEDTQSIEIKDANIYCYVNGNIWLEINSLVNQHINEKRFYESAPIYQLKGETKEQPDILQFWELDGLEREMVQQAYEGDYEIEGQTVEGWKIKAIIADANFQVTLGLDHSENMEQEGKSQVRLRDLDIDYNLDSLEEGGTQEIVYGLANIEVIHNLSAKIGNLEAEMCIESVSTRESRNKSGILSAEMTLKNIRENEQDSYETYSAWLISLLSLASGHCVAQIYRIEAVRYEHFQIKSEYWSGRELRNEARGVAVIQSPDLYLFIQQCAKKLTLETFSDKGVGLALTWYMDTFVSPMAEVNFLLLCTVLESLNKKHSSNASKGLLPTKIYQQIREEILKLVSEFPQGIDNQDDVKKYNIFQLKVEKSFASGSYNQIGDLRTSIEEMFKTYSVPYEDLFPKLEFIKIRDKIVHEGFGGVDVALELRKLSNLVVRVFLAILGYQGNYMESIKIEIDDPLGRSKHGLICRSFPFIASEDNTESNSIDTCC